VPEIRIFFTTVIIIAWGESGKTILNETLLQCKHFQLIGSVLFVQVRLVCWALPKYFSGKDGSVPLEKIGPYAYAD